MKKVLFTVLALGACIGAAEAFAKSRKRTPLTSALPGEVKRAVPRARPARRNKHLLAVPTPPPPLSLPALTEDAPAGGAIVRGPGPRARSRSVFFWSTSKLFPLVRVCDEATRQDRMRDAQLRALEKCEEQLQSPCEVRDVRIVKQGPLNCQDLAGSACDSERAYSGCVAQAEATRAASTDDEGAEELGQSDDALLTLGQPARLGASALPLDH